MIRSTILFVIFLLAVTLAGAQDRRSEDPRIIELTGLSDSLVLHHKLDSLADSDNEDDLSLLMRYYYIKRIKEKIEVIKQLAINRFPVGATAFSDALGKIYDEKDGKENEKKYADFVEKFGSNPQFAGHRYFESSKFFVASSFADEDDEKVVEWIEKIQDTVYKTKAYSYGCRELMANKRYETAEKLIRRSIADLERRSHTGTPEYNEYAKAAAAVLLATGKYDEGFRFAKVAHERSNGKDKALNQTYLDLLLVTKQYAEAFPLMEESVRTGQANTLIKESLKVAYQAIHGNTRDFDTYEASLYATLKDSIRTHLLANMENEAACNFSLKDIDGNTVTLASLRGKVLILDFWATWCGPCKASFPKMQLIVDKYKNDPNVEFLFIHTWETSRNPYKDAGDYIKDNHYTFKVLMDTKDPDTRTNAAAAGFKVKGIPTKFIVDKNGMIRFRSVGSDAGGEDAFLEEMALMIELAKENNINQIR